MVRLNEVRRNEIAVEAPASFDAGLTFIGVIRTPWTSRLECPRQGRADGPICRIEVAEPWVAALDGIEAFKRIEVLYWLHESRRDLVRQSPANDGETRGAFALRSPVRPNPIGTALASLVGAKGRRFWSGVWIASTGRRSSTSSPTGACSRRSPRPRRGFRDGVRARRAEPHRSQRCWSSHTSSPEILAPGECEAADGRFRVRFERFQRLAAPFPSRCRSQPPRASRRREDAPVCAERALTKRSFRLAKRHVSQGMA